MDPFPENFVLEWRLLPKNVESPAVTVLVLAIGIGVNTAIFSIVNSVLLQPLPYPDSQRLMLLQGLSGSRHIPVSYPEFLAWRDQKELFEDAAAFCNSAFALTGAGEPEQLRGMRISSALLPMVGARP